MKKIGIFGGTLNPIHLGHINAITTVKEKLELDHVFVVPVYQNPHKKFSPQPTPQQRMQMVNLALEEEDNVSSSNYEVEEKEMSYTYKTIEHFTKEYPEAKLSLIIGVDSFLHFSSWKNYEQILDTCDLVVISRIGHFFPSQAEDLPEGLSHLVEEYAHYKILLKNANIIEFIQLQDRDCSSSQIRKYIRSGRQVNAFLSYPVEDYIKKENLYKLKEADINYKEVFAYCYHNITDRKGEDVLCYRNPPESAFDYMLLSSVNSGRQARSLSQHVILSCREKYGVSPMGVDGDKDDGWMVLDYMFFAIHIFQTDRRSFYRLETLSRNQKEITNDINQLAKDTF